MAEDRYDQLSQEWRKMMFSEIGDIKKAVSEITKMMYDNKIDSVSIKEFDEHKQNLDQRIKPLESFKDRLNGLYIGIFIIGISLISIFITLIAKK